jgi:pilus assembly protein Flp/PilA
LRYFYRRPLIGVGLTLRAWEETMIDRIKSLCANESGATAIEYALIASLIALVIIASLTSISSKLQNTFNEVSTGLK